MENCNKISKIEQGPLLSVVVPAYNIEKYLSKCLDSILTQSYKNIEIVVVDDGSTDHTGYIADQYQNKYPDKIVCLHLKNGGVLRARLKGIEMTSGEWIGFVDGDDQIESDMYERLISNALKHDADIAHCGYQTIVNNGERIHFFYNTGRIVVQDNITGIKDLIEGLFVEPGLWNKIFKKELFFSLMEVSILEERLKINEDLLMNYLLFKKSEKSVYEDFCPYHYMVRNTSATRSRFQVYKALDPVKVRKIILDDVVNDLKDIAWRKYLICCLNACVALCNQKEHLQVYREIKDSLENNKVKWKLLGKKELLKIRIFLFSSRLYKFIFGIYERYFQ